MPPGTAYNWLCVIHGAVDILSYAARHRANQVTPQAVASYANPRKRRRTDTELDSEAAEAVHRYYEPRGANERSAQVVPESLPVEMKEAQIGGKTYDAPLPPIRRLDKLEIVKDSAVSDNVDQNNPPVFMPKASRRTPTVELPVPPPISATPPRPSPAAVEAISEVTSPKVEPASQPKQEFSTSGTVVEDDVPAEEALPIYPTPSARNLQSSKVPSSRIGRLFHYGGLAASLGYGAASEVLRRTGTGSQDQSSVMMTEANIKRLVSKLSQMRGAALKLGQFMSIQGDKDLVPQNTFQLLTRLFPDTHILPPEIDKIFRRVQDSAHYMPDWQMEQVMTSALGPSWSENFTSFERIPFAAASIGQVHTAVLAAAVSPTGHDEKVAVKIQFPNIANSIASDLGYIKMLLTAGKLLPKGLFLDKTINAMKSELADECDYIREASFLKTFRSSECLGNDPRFKVPWVWDGSASTVLVMEHVDGISVGEANAHNLTQEDRNDIASNIIELCLKELFEFRTMQTDPNWTNFLWNPRTRQVELVDFGATRTYSKEFMDSWFSILQAATLGDRDACIDWSLKVGYLTGQENELMLDAHVNSMTLLATPFKPDTSMPFAFGQGTQWSEITAQIRAQIPVMLQHRLTPPPKETYSLNRKLSGAFLLASRLGATVDTRAIWDKVVGKYVVG
ncbi:hypothetical protein D9619_009181 [Psilocybe cf. subviscida]|uniref:ABC1 atypical kinase-like domain-containing protein n=1 Tax=Psilocybe cf. subviscida TaxID=2480587 RepID=A0A8H5BTN6_9AGAR|nr:hypothetical protein D9619_009181 [Psilocybe cf. subviscida]